MMITLLALCAGASALAPSSIVHRGRSRKPATLRHALNERDDILRAKDLLLGRQPLAQSPDKPEAAPAEWTDRERRPKVFELDMLRCIYCGFCEEACPCDAIRLTPKFYTPTTSRAERVYDKQRLLNNNPAAQTPQRPRK